MLTFRNKLNHTDPETIRKIAASTGFFDKSDVEVNYTLAKNVAFNFDENHEFGYETSMLDKIIYKEIIKSLDKFGLTNKENIVFKMYYVNDLSIKEISEKLNTKEANIKYFLYSARKKVKERYYD